MESLKKIFSSDADREVFKKYIEHIRFPRYKNFADNLQIKFTFPITFLVGVNGIGKSSLLQALYGAPIGKSIGEFWFTTDLDPIIELANNRNKYIYGYKTHLTKTDVEILKTRIHKKDKPEYWEPARPQVSLGMKAFPKTYNKKEASSTRWNVLDKNVVYSDFRYELSAFDKYFYFGSKPNSKTLKSKQDVIRKYAKKIKSAYEQNKDVVVRTRRANKPTKLDDKEIKIISHILEKPYKEAYILEHDFYEKMKGFSIKYTTDNLHYSEAFAGSGETAVVKLVHDIYQAKQYSLILLDEPETSLHPGAQKKLIEFIIQQVKEKKMQVVISTHSPDMIQNAPKEAIKVFYSNSVNNKTEVIKDIVPQQAFNHIGHEAGTKKTLIVEDILAEMILESVLKEIGGSELFEIKFFPGGESRLKQEFMLVYSKEESTKHFIIFDGDQKTKKINISMLREMDKNVKTLEEKIYSIVNENIKFATDGHSREDQKIDLMLKYIKFHSNNVFYLPKMIPEEIIWSDEVLNRIDIEEEQKQEILGESALKNKFNVLAKYLFGNDTAQEQKQAYQYFLVKWLKHKNQDYQEIVDILEKLKAI